MRREEIRKYQLAQLELLKYVTNICNEEKLRYFLVWGSLLGAIRHKGFIPWDADIDIAMFRDDYETLCEYLTKNENNGKKIFLSTYVTEENKQSPHAVVKIKGTHLVQGKGYSTAYKEAYDGIYIDVFPIDEIPEKISLQKEQLNKIAFLQKLIFLKYAPIYGAQTNIIKKIIKKTFSFLLKPIPLHWLHKKMDEIYKKYDDGSSTLVAMLTDPLYYPKQTFTKDIFGNGRICKFEDSEFIIPEKAEEFLKIAYGDYMKLPPVDSRYTYLDNMISYVDYGRYGDEIRL